LKVGEDYDGGDEIEKMRERKMRKKREKDENGW